MEPYDAASHGQATETPPNLDATQDGEGGDGNSDTFSYAALQLRTAEQRKLPEDSKERKETSLLFVLPFRPESEQF